MKKLTPQESADHWNATYPIGTPVTRYLLIDPLAEPTQTKTRSAAWVLGGHTAMVQVEGVAGYVLLESVVPSKWQDVSYTWDKGLRQRLQRKAPMAGKGFVADGACEIELCRHYSGSGDDAFGGADEWPHLTVQVGFPVGAEAARDALAAKIMALIDAEVPLE